MNEYAVIGKLKLNPIPDSKTMQMAYYGGMSFAVSKDFNENDLYVIFLPDGQLSKEYAEANDCIRRTDPNTGAHVGGFFEQNRKVRSITLMKGKVRSVGYVAALDSLAFTGYNLSKLKEGTYVSELNKIPICNKFVNKATRKASNKNLRKIRDLKGFDKHSDTKQWYREKDIIEPGALVTITEKLDGTSVRFGKAYESIRYKKFKKLLNKILPLKTEQYVPVFGTRNVTLDVENKPNNSFYEDDSIYLKHTLPLKEALHPGEVIYGEVVGWIDEDRPLFKRGDVTFKYGTLPGNTELYVYAIKWTLPDGTATQLSWDKVKDRALELGLKSVPELFSIKMLDYNYPTYTSFDFQLSEVDEMVNSLKIGESVLDPSHIREGVVIRVDQNKSTKFLKAKSDEFYALENTFKENESNVDFEESH